LACIANAWSLARSLVGVGGVVDVAEKKKKIKSIQIIS
jgi:hypothetical protein